MDYLIAERMHRTTVYLPPELVDRARQAARNRGITVGALVRSGLERVVDVTRPEPIGGFLSSGRADP